MDWSDALEKEEFGKISAFCNDPCLKSYSQYKLNNLNNALDQSQSISNTNIKHTLQAQIYYRLNDYNSALDSYSKSNVSGSELQCNMLFLKNQISQSTFEETFNSILLACSNADYKQAFQLMSSIDMSTLDDEDLMNLKLQKGLIFYKLDEYKKSIQLFIDLLLELDSPFYMSPKLRKYLPFVKIWPNAHKSSSIKHIKTTMSGNSALIVPTTINLLAVLSDYLSNYFVTLFLQNHDQQGISKCKDASYLFKQCIKSNSRWLQHLTPRYTPYDEALKELLQVADKDYWLYKIHKSMTLDDVKLLRNEQGIKTISLFKDDASNVLDDAILYAEIRNGKTIDKENITYHRVMDADEFIDLDFSK